MHTSEDVYKRQVMLFILILNVAGFYLLNKNLLKKSAEMQRIIPKERKDIYQIANQVDFIKQNEMCIRDR